MTLEEAKKAMENDTQVMHNNKKWYIWYINSLNNTCMLSDRVVRYVGTKINEIDVNIKELGEV